MKILRAISDLKLEHTSWRGKTVGFVPTMGALHAGHAQLLKAARGENDFVVLSIYVNQAQFNDPKDYERYPKTLTHDLKIAEAAGVDFVFLPETAEIYPDGYRYRVSENEFSRELCGVFRPGHFDGVLTVVLKFFLLIQPNNAYFGEKDFQQMSLIKGMVESFFLPLKIRSVPTVREQSGLAMSSRNTKLSEAGRVKAAEIHEVLVTAATPGEVSEQLKKSGFKVEYVRDLPNGRRLIAAWLEGVRLIDNVQRSSADSARPGAGL